MNAPMELHDLLLAKSYRYWECSGLHKDANLYQLKRDGRFVDVWVYPAHEDRPPSIQVECQVRATAGYTVNVEAFTFYPDTILDYLPILEHLFAKADKLFDGKPQD